MNFRRCVFTALCTLVLFLLTLSPIRIDDLFLYLTFGRRLLSQGEFGAVDSLIFTVKDYHWELWHEWLAYIIYYSTYLTAGYQGLIVLRALLVAATGYIVWKACDRAKLNPLLSAAILAASVYVASPRIFRDRSSVFTDLFCVLLLFLYTDERFTNRRWKWALPLLFLLWIQIHSGYLAGWIFVGLFYVSGIWFWNKRERKDWFFISLACALVTLINPMFFDGVMWPIRAILGYDWGVLAQLTEFTPTLSAEFLHTPYKIFLCLFMLLGAGAAALNVRREGWFPLAVALTLTVLGLRYSRMVALCGFGMGIVFSVSLAHRNWARIQFRFAHAATITVAVLFCLLLLFSEERGLRFLLTKEPLHGSVPEKAVDVLLSLPPGNVFNEWSLGGYLAWKLDGRQKIAAHGFISDPEVVQKYIYRFSVSREGWNEIILGNDVRYFFLRRQSFEESRGAAWIQMLMGPGWRNVYSDGAAVLFEKAVSN